MHTPVQISAEINNSFGCGKKEANKGTLLEWHGRHGRADVSSLDERRTMGDGPPARNRDMTQEGAGARRDGSRSPPQLLATRRDHCGLGGRATRAPPSKAGARGVHGPATV
jgi:hypothetical protein